MSFHVVPASSDCSLEEAMRLGRRKFKLVGAAVPSQLEGLGWEAVEGGRAGSGAAAFLRERGRGGGVGEDVGELSFVFERGLLGAGTT